MCDNMCVIKKINTFKIKEDDIAKLNKIRSLGEESIIQNIVKEMLMLYSFILKNLKGANRSACL